MDSSRSISELKSAFIWSQVRIFSESLQLPEDWRNYAAETTEDDLSDKVIEEVLHKLNAAAKQHNRVVYSPQAIHHVAQQIANLYWSSVSQEARSRDAFARGIEKTTDLSRQMNITKLPVELEYQEATEEEYARYRQLREHLTNLDNQRQSRQRRLDQLQQLRRLLEPFENPQEDIQPNLITRDGELVQELEKMRMLVARVGGRIAQQKTSSGGPETREYSLPGSDQRLEALLNIP
ncbi:Kinetochore Sim4 complex subunit Fta4 [Penicillium sp. DV-2018c]|nr:Kinetochore Sim4 complex subunit Fta4 [Penicillium sp. DV-2018c]KAJ5576998.1 Kinetochore Sim4 complex subunit Fta4 [Penicillium sp. DV-2018c]